jgi:hypothetical protein
MALFPMSGVLRRFFACGVLSVGLGENLCAALLIEKTAHLFRSYRIRELILFEV